MSKVLVVGAGGQVSTELVRLKPDWCTLENVGQEQLDLVDTPLIADFVAASNPDLVINAAAYTAVDGAEAEPDLAQLVNALAPGQIAIGAARAQAPVIHLSTDYVFDGTSQLPYKENDRPAPLGVYGHTKLEGEHAVIAGNSRHLIIRTSWVYSAHGHNFVKSMLKLGAEREVLTIVADQFGNPTAAHDLARTIWLIGRRLLSDPQTQDYGLLHAAGTGIATWYDFAKGVFMLAKNHGGPNPTIVPILTKDYPTPARRPANSRLDLTRLETKFGITTQPWLEALDSVVLQLVAESKLSE